MKYDKRPVIKLLSKIQLAILLWMVSNWWLCKAILIFQFFHSNYQQEINISGVTKSSKVFRNWMIIGHIDVVTSSFPGIWDTSFSIKKFQYDWSQNFPLFKELKTISIPIPGFQLIELLQRVHSSHSIVFWCWCLC